ncbi:Ig-like domain-containing protein, partial [bacterium]|nr:Ig-like domain-containing protein [bacterium]
MKRAIWMVIFVSLLAILVLVSCGEKKEEVERAKEIPERAEVAEPVGPLQIVSYGPTGETKGQVQIRIDFALPLIPLTTLSDVEREMILDHFVLAPDVEGKFRLSGTSSVVFEPAHSLPMAATYQVTVTKGLKNLQEYELEEDFTWEFQTPLPQIEIRPRDGAHHIKIDTEIWIRSTIALDMKLLKNHIEFYETLSSDPITYLFLESERNPKEDQDIGMHRVRYEYILNPKRNLKRDTQYTVTVNPGVMTSRGNRPTEKAVSSNFRIYPPFRFVATGFCTGCGRKLTTAPYLAFTNTPDFKRLEGFIAIEPEPKRWPFGRHGCIKYSLAVNDLLLEPNTTYTVTLHPGLRDIYGQDIENDQTVTFTTGDLTPQMWGPRGYQIITPNIEPRLGIKTVNINTIFYKLLSLRPQDVLVRERLDDYYFTKKLISEIQSEEQRLNIPLNESGIGKSYFDLRPFLQGEQHGVVAYTFRSPTVQCHSRPI